MKMKNTLALSMIVRDAEEQLGDCLSSCRELVDEIVIGDTGSRDRTISIAKSFGATVVTLPWMDDFAAARNAVLHSVETDWVLVLDADELLDPDARTNLRTHLQNRAVAGYQVAIRNYVTSLNERLWDQPARRNDSTLERVRSYPAFVEHQNVRLFRRDPRIRFEGRVHETVGRRILSVGFKLERSEFCIHHLGMTASQENRARKNLLYRRLGIEKIKEMPDDAQAHFELGLVELDNFANLEGALELFRKTRLLNSRFQQAWFFEGVTLARLERFSEAIVCLRQSEKAGLRTALVAEVLGDTYYNLGKFDDSARMFRISLTRSKDHLRVESKLGLALVRDGQSKSGLEHLKNAVLCAPADPELHDRLLQAFVSLNQFDNAAAVADSKLEATLQPASADFLRAAALWFQLGRLARSAAILEVGLQMYPREETLRKGLEQLARHNSD